MAALAERTASAVRALSVVLVALPFLVAIIAVLQTAWWLALGAVAVLAVAAPPFATDRFRRK
jgi:hypothetical protein